MKKNKKIIVGIHRIIFCYVVLAGWLLVVAAVSYVMIKDTNNATNVLNAFSQTKYLWEIVWGIF
ncbi:MAG: hypothetical protein LBR70_05190 [Lactobacillaceae bacterium]|jgi:hypothetical protein|nr:hypothetical protein [Lactobacillaceae bacterium]